MFGAIVGAGLSIIGGSVSQKQAQKQQIAAMRQQAYDSEYTRAMNQEAGKEALAKAQANIAAVKQDKILTDINIQMSQDAAEAQATAAAAAAGVEGGSVEAVKLDTEINEVMAKQANARAEEQGVEDALSAIGQASATIISNDEVAKPGQITGGGVDWAGSLAGIATSMSDDQFKDLGNSFMGMFGK